MYVAETSPVAEKPTLAYSRRRNDGTDYRCPGRIRGRRTGGCKAMPPWERRASAVRSWCGNLNTDSPECRKPHHYVRVALCPWRHSPKEIGSVSNYSYEIAGLYAANDTRLRMSDGDDAVRTTTAPVPRICYAVAASVFVIAALGSISKYEPSRQGRRGEVLSAMLSVRCPVFIIVSICVPCFLPFTAYGWLMGEMK